MRRPSWLSLSSESSEPTVEWELQPEPPWVDPSADALDPEQAIEAAPWRVSFLVELPFDLPLPLNTNSAIVDRGHFAGFEDAHVAPLPWMDAMPEPGLRPISGIWFRRAEVPGRDTMDSIVAAFAEYLPHTLKRRRRMPWQRRTPGLTERRAVVQLTRIAAAPTSEVEGEHWVSDAFDEVFAQLNELLVIVASLAREPAVGALTREELPPVLPYLFTDLGPVREGRDPVGPELSIFVLHVAAHGMVGEDIRPELFSQAGNIQAMHRTVGHPFFTYAEMMGSARRWMHLGRATQAVLDTGTAIELLISAVVREVAPLRGYDASKTTAVLEGALRSRVEHHIPKLAAMPVDLNDRSNAFGRWWQGGYRTRNAVVHEGARPTIDDALNTLDDAENLVAELARRLHADSVTREVGALLVGAAP